MSRSPPPSHSVTPSRRLSAARTPSGFIAEVRGDDPDLASYLRIEERGARGGRAQLEAIDTERVPSRTAPSQKNSAPHPHAEQVTSPWGRNGSKPIQTWRLGPGASNL